MFLYSKTDQEIWVHCQDIATDIGDIGYACGDLWESTSGVTVARVRGAKDFAGHYTAVQSQNC